MEHIAVYVIPILSLVCTIVMTAVAVHSVRKATKSETEDSAAWRSEITSGIKHIQAGMTGMQDNFANFKTEVRDEFREIHGEMRRFAERLGAVEQTSNRNRDLLDAKRKEH